MTKNESIFIIQATNSTEEKNIGRVIMLILL